MIALRAGAVYFLIAFAAGFAFGTMRVLALAPVSGATLAVLIETPFMLAVSWFACRWCVRRFRVPARADSRILMGALAFAMLIGAEFALGAVGFGRSLAEQAGHYATAAGAIGLAAQMAFAALPLIEMRWPGKSGI